MRTIHLKVNKDAFTRLVNEGKAAKLQKRLDLCLTWQQYPASAIHIEELRTEIARLLTT